MWAQRCTCILANNLLLQESSLLYGRLTVTFTALALAWVPAPTPSTSYASMATTLHSQGVKEVQSTHVGDRVLHPLSYSVACLCVHKTTLSSPALT